MKAWLKSLRSRLWESLSGKGKYTSLMGICVIIASITKPLIRHNQEVVFEDGYMWQTLYFVAIGIILIILPSYMKISKDGVEIRD